MKGYKIEKYLRPEGTEELPKRYFAVIEKTEDSDPRGFEVEGLEGKYLNVVTNFPGASGKQIISINPLTFPELEDYEEVPEQTAKQLQKQKQQERKVAIEQAKQERKAKLEAKKAEKEAKKDKLVAAFDAGKLYEGDEELFEAAHGFTPTEHKNKNK